MRVSLLLYVDRDRMDYYSIRDVEPRTSTSSMLLYIHRDRMDYRDVHLDFYTAM